MTQIDAWTGSVAHYATHLMPIIRALPEDRRGHLYCPRSLRADLPWARHTAPPASSAPLLVGGYQDTTTARRPKVLVQHGAGQTYLGLDQPSYDGGPGREHVGLFLCPREESAQRNRDRYHGALACAVGCPKLDEWATIPRPENEILTVAVSFHWPAALHREVDGHREMIPEAGWAFQSWRDHIGVLARDPSVRVLGHGHPRARGLLENYWASLGVEAEWAAREVVRRADVLVIDNSSFGAEFAACGRPVVWLNDGAWRKDIHHGGRFWEWVEGQIILDPGDDLLGAVHLAAGDPPAVRAARERMVRQVYGQLDGRASERAVAAVLAWEADGCPHHRAYAATRPCGC